LFLSYIYLTLPFVVANRPVLSIHPSSWMWGNPQHEE
jgi:hypothetical protein